MRYLKRSIKCYLPFALNEFKVFVAYRIPFIIRLISQGFTIFITYCLWAAIYASSNDTVLGGFTLNEMVNYVIISFFTNTLITSEMTQSIAYEIADGSIAMNLLKPISYRTRYLASSLGAISVGFIIIFIPFILLFTKIGWLDSPGIGMGLLYCLSVIFSFLLLFFFGFCFSMIAFKTTYFFGMNMAKNVFIKFFSGAMIPLSFFPKEMAVLLKWLPFSSMNYTPIMIYLNKLSMVEIYQTLSLQLFWILFFYLLSSLLWKGAVKQLTILGG